MQKELNLDTRHLVSETTLIDEEWKDIEGYEGVYAISNCGNIKSYTKLNSRGQYLKQRILKPVLMKNGYYTVTLYKDGCSSKKYIHRLVAEAFIPNSENKSTVDHINRDRLDNRVENLRWATYSEQRGNQISTERYILALKDGFRQIFKSQTEASRITGVDSTTISHIVNYKYNRSNGWTFIRLNT